MTKERDDLTDKLVKLQTKYADNSAVFSRLERELGLGSTSPMDWDRTGKTDLVERVVNAFKTKAGGDASLKSAHETLIKQHQALATQLQEEQAKTKPTESPCPSDCSGGPHDERGRPLERTENYHAHVSAPEKGGDIHIHLHIV